MYRVMAVDDEVVITMQLARRLAAMGYEVVGTACSGAEAMEKAELLRPDVILMDIVMPGGIDGIDAIRTIKSNPENSNCKVIILSGSEKDCIREGYDAGACDFFIKPFSPLNLISKVDYLFEDK